MSLWAKQRKARQPVKEFVDPVENLTRRVAWRICTAVYQNGICDCKARQRGQCCDQMKLAAQHAFAEIKDG